MGIPRSALGKIWERFYKSDLSRGKDKKGTGLGLAIVKEAIQAHGENITVVSTEGVGTEFSFFTSEGCWLIYHCDLSVHEKELELLK